MVYCTAAAEVWKTCSIWGMAGRYMSMETGAKACSIPNKNKSSKCRGREMGMVCCAITGEAISVAGVSRREARAGHQNAHGGERYRSREIFDGTSPKVSPASRVFRCERRAACRKQPE
jgi:hypothetical protein